MIIQRAKAWYRSATLQGVAMSAIGLGGTLFALLASPEALRALELLGAAGLLTPQQVAAAAAGLATIGTLYSAWGRLRPGAGERLTLRKPRPEDQIAIATRDDRP